MTPFPERDRFIVLSGCSGGGKSSILEELARRGYATVGEPGRRIVQAETDPASARLPWNSLAGFSQAAIELALDDYRRAQDTPGLVFFDRGLIDALLALQHATAQPPTDDFISPRRYHRLVFLTPPWEQIYVADAERRHAFAEATREYERLVEGYPTLGYDVSILPRTDISTRADIVLERLAAATQE